MRWLFGLLILACLPLSLPAQQPYMWRLTDEDGLPSMSVYDVFQDSRGYMWFGTESGICRFDGRAFKVYPAPSAKSRSATSITEDRYGNIWFRNFAKQIFSIEQEKVMEMQMPEGIKDALGYQFSQGDSLFLMDWNMLYVTSTKRKKWQKVTNFPAKNNLLWEIHSHHDKSLWVFSDKEIHSYRAGKFTRISQTEHPKRFFSKSKKLYTFEDTRRRMLVWEGEQARQVLDSRTFEEMSKQLIHSLYIDNAHNYWFATSTGVFGYDVVGKPLFAGKPLLPNIDVSHILQDREGVYWISTLKEGVFVMPQLDIQLFNTQNSNLPTEAVNCLGVQDNRLLLGFNNGSLGLFDAQKGMYFVYQTQRKQQVETFYYHPWHKKLYVSAGTLLVFEPNNPTPIDSYFSGSIKKIAFLNEKDAILAAGGEAKMVRIYPKVAFEPPLDREWHKYYKVVKGSNETQPYPIYFIQLLSKRTRSVWVDKQKQEFWIASVDGLLLYQKGGVREVFDEKGKAIYGISFGQTADGTIWVGTIEQGLYAIRDQKIVAHFTQDKELTGNFCKTLWAEGRQVWFSTGKGIQRYDVQTKDFAIFNKHDGLHTYDISDLRILRDTLWVSTPKGLLCLHKDSLKRNTTPPLIYIQSFKISENEYKLNDSYTLAHDKNNIKIDFQGLAYRSRGEFRYKYRMLGLDSTWIYTNNANNFARYPSLPVGTFEFQVKAVNEDGVESDGMSIIQIIVLPPWWQTWWAMLLWLFLGLGLVWVFVWWRLRRVQERNRVEQELRSSQLSALKVQMNPHFIFNALNSIQEFIWLNEKRLANQYLGKFADLMRLTLDMSNENVVSLAEEIKVLHLYLELEAVRFENLAYQIDVSETILTEEVYIPSMLIQPYLENAIKHGLLHRQGKREVSLQVCQNEEKNTIICTIEDNGIGRAKSQEIQQARPKTHKSFATSATKKRLELLNYGKKQVISVQFIDLLDEAGKPAGTKVILQIPIQDM